MSSTGKVLGLSILKSNAYVDPGATCVVRALKADAGSRHRLTAVGIVETVLQIGWGCSDGFEDLGGRRMDVSLAKFNGDLAQ